MIVSIYLFENQIRLSSGLPIAVGLGWGWRWRQLGVRRKCCLPPDFTVN